jgi:hypothetical protein
LITNIHAQQNQAISFIQNNKTIKISTFKEVISLDKKPFLFRFFSFLFFCKAYDTKQDNILCNSNSGFGQ